MTAVLTLENVSKTFTRSSSPRYVLTDVQLELHAGMVVGLQGSRASGKTTLLRIAAGELEPDRGRVLLDGQDLATMDEPARLAAMRAIAHVSVEGPVGLAELPMREWLALPLYVAGVRRKDARPAVEAALERAGVREYADALWHELADSDQALMALAQALVRRPRVLLVDDPIAAPLHIDDRERILGLVADAATRDGCAVLLAVQAFAELAGVCDTAGILSDGILVAELGDEAGGSDPAGGDIVPFPPRRSA